MKHFILSLFYFTLISVALAACGNPGAISTSTPPKEAVALAMEKLENVDSYYCSIKVDTKNPAPSEATEAYFYDKKPETFWLKLVGPSSGVEMLHVGKNIFFKTKDGMWLKVKESDVTDTMRNPWVFDFKTNKLGRLVKWIDLKATGNEKIDGKDFLIYESVYSNNSREKIWISVDTGLPKKLVISSESLGSYTLTYDYEKKMTFEPGSSL